MTTAIHLCGPADLLPLTGLMARFRAENAPDQTDEDRAAAVGPLLDGSPFGAAYLLGPARAPVGYVLVTLGWSVEMGGMVAWIDEVYIRPKVRRRGIATETLLALSRTLNEAGVRAIHLQSGQSGPENLQLWEKAGFTPRDGSDRMTRRF